MDNKEADIIREVTELKGRCERRKQIALDEDRPVEHQWCEKSYRQLKDAEDTLLGLQIKYREAKQSNDEQGLEDSLEKMLVIKTSVFKSVHADLLMSRPSDTDGQNELSSPTNVERHRRDDPGISQPQTTNAQGPRKATATISRRSASSDRPASRRQQPADGHPVTNINYYYYSGMSQPQTTPNEKPLSAGKQVRPVSVESGLHATESRPHFKTVGSQDGKIEPEPDASIGYDVRKNTRMVTPVNGLLTPATGLITPTQNAPTKVLRKKRKPGPKPDAEMLCPFCGEQNVEFKDDTKRNSHFRDRCPMLTNCVHCKKGIEVRHMFEHQLAGKCPKLLDLMERCRLCGLPATPDEATDGSHSNCKKHRAPGNGDYCPLCLCVVTPADTDAGWRLHLFGGDGCRANPRALLSGTTDQKTRKKVTLKD